MPVDSVFVTTVGGSEGGGGGVGGEYGQTVWSTSGPTRLQKNFSHEAS